MSETMERKGKRIIVASILMVILIAVPVVQAVATSISLFGVEWNHTPTVFISLQKGVDSSYITEVQTAFKDWASGLDRGFTFVFVSSSTKTNPADIVVTVKKNTGNVLGSTSVSSSGGYIKKVSITLSAYNAMGIPLQRSDFRSIARHEIGHAIGLGHANDNGQGSVDLMYPYFDFVAVGDDVYPSNLDIKAVTFIYGTDGFGAPNHDLPLPSTYP